MILLELFSSPLKFAISTLQKRLEHFLNSRRAERMDAWSNK